MNTMLTTTYKGIQTNVTIFPKVPNDKIIEELSKNNVLLLFNDYSILGTKIFDYLMSQRKILLCYADDSDALQLKDKYYSLEEVAGVSQQLQADMIENTESGDVIKDAAHLYLLLEKLVEEQKAHGKIESTTKNIEQYSRQFQTERLANILKDILVRRQK
jgi:CDP-glycerol glycerophosphotransferase (TagB/SpsB family)